MSVLTIISHTEHYKSEDGTIVGLGSTVTEINHLITVFDEVRHIAMLHSSEAPTSALPYTSTKIKFIPIKAVGGSGVLDKLAILGQAPKVIGEIRKSLKHSDYFQFRAPTGIGVFVIPYLILFCRKNGWFKYAGNWKQEHAPLAYRFQRWLLKNQKRPVTINGFWNDQPSHCLSFENPCLTHNEVELGNSIRTHKSFVNPLQLCFVGRLEAAKGLDVLIDAVAHLSEEERLKIENIHLVGVGKRMDEYQNKVKALKLPFVFHGFLSRKEVHKIYQQCHAIVLPSASEGFPKVIAEAMNYGCVPIVSNVSSIGHYIQDSKNGFLMNAIDVKGVRASLLRFLNLSQEEYKTFTSLENEALHRFSYMYYNHRVNSELL